MITCDGSLSMSESTAADGRLRLSLGGCLDIATAPQLDARLRELERDLRCILLDLERLTFIDLPGLRVIQSRLVAQRRGLRLLEVHPRLGPCVMRLVELTGVDLRPAPLPALTPIRALADGRLTRRRVPAPQRIRLSR